MDTPFQKLCVINYIKYNYYNYFDSWYCVELYNYCDLGWPIELEENSDELLIYPNPVKDILIIEGSSEVDVDIYDIIGNLFVSEKDDNQIVIT